MFNAYCLPFQKRKKPSLEQSSDPLCSNFTRYFTNLFSTRYTAQNSPFLFLLPGIKTGNITEVNFTGYTLRKHKHFKKNIIFYSEDIFYCYVLRLMTRSYDIGQHYVGGGGTKKKSSWLCMTIWNTKYAGVFLFRLIFKYYFFLCLSK